MENLSVTTQNSNLSLGGGIHEEGTIKTASATIIQAYKSGIAEGQREGEKGLDRIRSLIPPPQEATRPITQEGDANYTPLNKSRSREAMMANSAEFKTFFQKNPKIKTTRIELQLTAASIYLLRPGFRIIQGKRTIKQSAQNIAKGTSQLKDPKASKHTRDPAEAFDFAVLFDNGKCCQGWKKMNSTYAKRYGFISGMAYVIFQGLKKEFGWNWYMRNVIDWKFNDLGHIEIAERPYFKVDKRGER